MGVVFHPDFDKNRWIYLWYSPRQTYNQAMTGSGPYRQLRLSRFTLKDDNTLLDGSEKILLKLPASSTDRWHSGGPMVFDAYGDLWGTFGNNGYDLKQSRCDSGGSVLSKTSADSSAEWGSSDTHSLRGGFWRIHPDSTEKGYSIPSGNFGEYWADRFQQEGRATLAAQYRDTSKVLPEVYVKGERSNFSIGVHPTKRWLAWGTVNYASNNDEFTLTNHPIFSGFPYFMANNTPTCNHGKSKDKPTNTSPLHSGVDTLPPAVPGNYNNLENVAIGGPIYSFDPSVDYDKKFPPHFDNTWLMGSFATNHLWMARIDGSGQEPKAPANPVRMDGSGLFKNFPVRNFLQAMYGKEGALYVLNYSGTAYHDANNPGLFRVEYNGACRVPVGLARKLQPPYQSILINPAGIAIREAGAHRVALFDVKGGQVWSASAAGPREYRLEAIRNRAGLRPGVYFARVTTAAGSVEATVSVF
jgi:cytochrome c